MKFKNSEELNKAVKNNILNCKGENLECLFNINIEANIINAKDIKAKDINAWNIEAENIKAWNINTENIKAWNIKAGDIKAWNIKAWNIKADNIKADNIKADNIKAENINYYDVCFAYQDIICKSIKGKKKNSKHFVLDGKLTIKR